MTAKRINWNFDSALTGLTGADAKSAGEWRSQILKRTLHPYLWDGREEVKEQDREFFN